MLSLTPAGKPAWAASAAHKNSSVSRHCPAPGQVAACRGGMRCSTAVSRCAAVGIATEVAIFYVSEFVSLADELPRHEALVQAGINRMRPIAMTTFPQRFHPIPRILAAALVALPAGLSATVTEMTGQGELDLACGVLRSGP